MIFHHVLTYKFSIPIFTLTCIFLLNPFADAITGYFVGTGIMKENVIFSPSQLFRLFLTFIMFLQLKKRRDVFLFLFSVFYLLSIEIISFQYHQNFQGLLIGIISSYKLSFCFLLYIIIYRYIRMGVISSYDLIYYLINSATIYSVIILISNLLGISFGVYGDTLGSKGVFTSANGLGIFIGTAGLFSLYNAFSLRKTGEIIRICLFFYILLNLMTKAAIVLVISIMFMSFVYLKGRYKFGIVFLLALLLFYNSADIISYITSVTQVITMRYEHANSFIHFLLAGRVGYLEYAYEEYSLSWSLLYRVLFGMGYFVSFRNPYLNDFWEKSSSFLECELFDMFFMYGIIGFLFYVLLFCYGFRLAIRRHGKYERIFLLSWIVLYFHSAFAGHVLFNGMSVIAFVAVLVVLNNNDNNAHNESFVSIS